MKTRYLTYIVLAILIGIMLCSCNDNENIAGPKEPDTDKPSVSESVGWGRSDKHGSADTQITPSDKKSADDNIKENNESNQKSDDKKSKEDEGNMDKKKGFAPTPTAIAKDKKQTASPTKTPSNKR